MKEKKVLPEGIFLLRASIRNSRCSDDFIEGLSLGVIPYLTCGTCNRVHFDGSPTSNLSPRRLRNLRAKMAKDPERYVEHSEPFPYLELRTFFQKKWPQRAKTLFDCPCGFARYYEVFNWNCHDVEKAKRPSASVSWSPDGQKITATVEARFSDGHMATRVYSAKLVGVDCFWGEQLYRKYYLTDFSPPYKKLDIIEVGLDPENATNCFYKEYLHKAGWDFAARLHNLHGHLRLSASWQGRRVEIWWKDTVLPSHGIAGSEPQCGSQIQEMILERVRAQQDLKPTRSRVPLSDEELKIAQANREFQIGISDMVEGLEPGDSLDYL